MDTVSGFRKKPLAEVEAKRKSARTGADRLKGMDVSAPKAKTLDEKRPIKMLDDLFTSR